MIIYRAPTDADIDALAELGRTTFCETFAHLYQPEDLNAFLTQVYGHESIASDLSNAKRMYQVAEDGAGQLIGYCKLGFEVSLDYDPRDQRVMELRQLYILKPHQGGGVAARLMEWTLEQARLQQADEILLSVWAENFRAHRFYERYGFAWIADTYFMVGNHRDEEFLFLKKMHA